MRSHEAFRRKLARHLSHIAKTRLEACAGQPSGEDLKVIERCDALAASATTLSASACSEVNDMLADPFCARRFAAVWSDLPDALGTTVWPRSAGELVTWMVRQAATDVTVSRRVRSAEVSPPRRENDASPHLAAAVAGDFTGGLAVVAPMLAVWQVSQGLHQWRDASFASSHPATLATVMEPASPSGDRGTAPTEAATIVFKPSPGAPTCQVAVDLGARIPVGTVVSVVPRSPSCQPPLVTGMNGDPVTSFGLSLAFAATGLLSLKIWCWLRVGSPTPARTARHMRVAL